EDPRPQSFDHLSARQELGKSDSRHEAQQGNTQGHFKIHSAASAYSLGENKQHGVHVECIKAKHTVLCSRAAHQQHGGTEHGQPQEQLGYAQSPGEQGSTHSKISSNRRSYRVLISVTQASSSTRSRTCKVIALR